MALAGKPLWHLGAKNTCLSACMQVRSYYNNNNYLDTSATADLKRGRGGRSSFSGNVVTVFGASGHLGRFVCNRLGATGSQMIVPFRNCPTLCKDIKTTGGLGQVLFTEFHLRDEESIRRAVMHSNVVINLIGRDFETLNFSFEDAQVEGAGRIARICKEMGVKRLVHVSAMNCDREHEGYAQKGGSKFLKSKKLGEEIVHDAFPEAIIIRPSEQFGHANNMDRFIWYYLSYTRMGPAVLNYRYALPYGGKGIFKQPIYAGDVAQAIVNAAVKGLGAEGQIYQAVGPKRYEVVDMVDWFLRVVRRSGVYSLGFPETRIGDMKYHPFVLALAHINQLLQPAQFRPKGHVVPDRVERETVTDLVDPVLPLIDELGINRLEILENKGRFCAEQGLLYSQIHPYPGEWPDPYPAKSTEPHKSQFTY